MKLQIMVDDNGKIVDAKFKTFCQDILYIGLNISAWGGFCFSLSHN